MRHATSLWFFLVAFSAAGSLACAQDVVREVQAPFADDDATMDEDSDYSDDVSVEATAESTEDVTDVIQARRGKCQRRGRPQRGPRCRPHGKRHMSPECQKLMKALHQEMKAKRVAVMQACAGLSGQSGRGVNVLKHVSTECMAQIKALRQEMKAKRRAIAQQCGGHGRSRAPGGSSQPTPQPSPKPSPASSLEVQ